MDESSRKSHEHINPRAGHLKHRPQGAQSQKRRSQSSQTAAGRQSHDRERTQSTNRRVRTSGSTSQQRVRTTGQAQRAEQHRTPASRKPEHRSSDTPRPRYSRQASSDRPRRQTTHSQVSKRRQPTASNRQVRKPQQPKKKPFILRHPKGVAITIGVIAAAIAVLFFILTRTAPIVFANDALGISSEAASEARGHRIGNVLLLGTDSRNSSDSGRSDTIMILSGDFEHKKLKVTSLLRDTYVSIPGHGMNKLNSAYSYGALGKTGEDAFKSGAKAALRAVNRNFDTAITEYVVVDFTCTAKVVDAVGGVTVTIKSDAERQQLNKYLSDTASESGGTITADPVTSTGKQHLNGAQALAYSRIRYVGNGDFERTQRQRTVFQQVFKKAKKMSVFKQYKLYKTIKPYIHTSLSGFELFKYLFNVALIHNTTIKQQQIPDSTQVDVGMLHGVSYVFPKTLETNIETLHQFIYETSYVVSDTAKSISDEIETVWPY